MKIAHQNIKFFLLGLLTLTGMSVFAQATGDPKEDFLYGEFYIEQLDYKKALPFYLSALSANNTNCNINYRVGECYLNILGQQSNALSFLEKAVKSVTANYIPGRYTNQQAPPVTWMYLGDAYHRENMLQESSFAYHKYKSFLTDRDKDQLEVINRRIIGLGISFEYQRNIEFINMANMGSIINSRFSDYNPVLSGDQRRLIYTSFWESYDRILSSTLTPQGWTQPVELNDELKSKGDCYTTALSYDGNYLILVRKESEFNSDLYFSSYTDGKWSPIKPYGKNINSPSLESSACLSKDGNTLYFSSDRPGGLGGFDIYMSELKNGVWGKPINMGSTINTPYDEEAPYLSSDGQTFYFSSNGFETIGGMDFFYSKKDENGKWSRPENMGLPYNTTEDDVFLIYFTETETGYFSRETQSGLGKQDIIVVQNGDFTQQWLEQSAPVVNQKLIDSLENARTVVFGVENTYYHNIHTKKKYEVSEDTLKKNDLLNQPDPKTIDQSVEEDTVQSGKTSLVNTIDDTQVSAMEGSGVAGTMAVDASGAQASNGIGVSAGAGGVVAGAAATGAITTVTQTEGSSTSGFKSNDPQGISTNDISQTKQLAASEAAINRTSESGSFDPTTTGTKTHQISEQQNETEAIAQNQALADNTIQQQQQTVTSNSSQQQTPTNEVYASTISSDEMVYGQDSDNKHIIAAGGAPQGKELTQTESPPQKASNTTNELNRQADPAPNSTSPTTIQTSKKSTAVDADPTWSKSPDGREVVSATNNATAYNTTQPTGTKTATNSSAEPPSNSTLKSVAAGSGIDKELVDFYTIQIIALKNPRDADYFKAVDGIIVSQGADGFYRYTVGKYENKSEARKAVTHLRKQGYADAFIRKAFTVNNYGSSHSN